MDAFLRASVDAINRNGVNTTYTANTRVVNEIEGTVTNTAVTHVVKMYPKQIQANQYNYPTLVGKEVIKFYLANNALSFTVKVSDSITYGGVVYRIQSFQEHVAHGQVCLYRIIAVKG